jgi:hypothetical protein
MEPVPLKTRLLVPGDDMVMVAREALAAKGLTPASGDVLVICESPLAITQGRVVSVDELRPGLWARLWCRFFGTGGSLSTPYGMQAAIDEAGWGRIFAALVVGSAGRLVGRRGDFYRVAGRPVAWIDDMTGTLGPYSQDIVLGPLHPDAVARRVGAELGCGVAVVDVNELHRVEILAAHAVSGLDDVVAALRVNPQGNDDERTPLVLLRH